MSEGLVVDPHNPDLPPGPGPPADHPTLGREPVPSPAADPDRARRAPGAAVPSGCLSPRRHCPGKLRLGPRGTGVPLERGHGPRPRCRLPVRPRVRPPPPAGGRQHAPHAPGRHARGRAGQGVGGAAPHQRHDAAFRSSQRGRARDGLAGPRRLLPLRAGGPRPRRVISGSPESRPETGRRRLFPRRESLLGHRRRLFGIRHCFVSLVNPGDRYRSVA